MISTVCPGPSSPAASQRRLPCVFIGCLTMALCTETSPGTATLEETQQSFLRGDYQAAIAAGEKGARENQGDPEWPLVWAEALGQVGRYVEARDVLTQALKNFPLSLRL